MRRITLDTFRRIGRQEETMMRAVMPRTSANDTTPLVAFAAPAVGEVVARRDGSRLVKRGFTLGDVARVEVQ